MHLDGHVDDLLGIFSCGHFGHGRLLRDALSLVAKPCSPVSEQGGGI